MMRLLGIDDFLEFEKADDGTYQLGARVFGLVASAAMHGDQAAAVNRVLQDLRDLTGETASLHVRRGDQRVCVASATSRHQLRRVIPIGDAVSLVGTVPGDIFLAGEPETERDELVSAVLSGRARRAELEKIQFAADHGYSVARQHDLHKAAKRLEPWMEADWFVTRNGLGPRLAKRRTSSSSVSRKMSGDRLGHVGRSGSCVCLGASGRVVTWRRR